MDDKPYIHAGANRATWVEHLESNPELILGHAISLCPAAVRVTNDAEFKALRKSTKASTATIPEILTLARSICIAWSQEPQPNRWKITRV